MSGLAECSGESAGVILTSWVRWSVSLSVVDVGEISFNEFESVMYFNAVGPIARPFDLSCIISTTWAFLM